MLHSVHMHTRFNGRDEWWYRLLQRQHSRLLHSIHTMELRFLKSNFDVNIQCGKCTMINAVDVVCEFHSTSDESYDKPFFTDLYITYIFFCLLIEQFYKMWIRSLYLFARLSRVCPSTVESCIHSDAANYDLGFKWKSTVESKPIISNSYEQFKP